MWQAKCVLVKNPYFNPCVVDMSPSQSFLLWVCSTPRVALFVVNLSPSQSLLLCFAQHLESLCSLLTLSRLSQPFLNTSTRSCHCSDVSDSFLNTLTFVELVLVSFSPFCRSNLFLLMQRFQPMNLKSREIFYLSGSAPPPKTNLKFKFFEIVYFCIFQ